MKYYKTYNTLIVYYYNLKLSKYLYLECFLLEGFEMFVGRINEMKFLEDYYSRTGSHLIILYGRKGIGKTEIIKQFSAKKDCVYYAAKEISKKEQFLSMKYELNSKEDSYDDVFDSMFSANEVKNLLIIDEFNFIVKNDEDFMNSIVNILNKNINLMVILSSSSINWVENEMVGQLGMSAMKISAFLKVKEFSFIDIVNRFPEYSVEESIKTYAVLGGIPGYLRFWNEGRGFYDNIRLLILDKDSRFYNEPFSFLKGELRELGIYNTILYILASGNIKMNDIYKRTGFSRAKISVYLKNLIELDIVEKVFSYDTSFKENTKVGLYRIKDNFIHFWYKFVFPNLSQLEMGEYKQVYEKKVLPYIEEYINIYFVKICTEYINLMNQFKKLPIQIERGGSWFGKQGTIDYIGADKSQNMIVANCKWSMEPMDIRDFEKLVFLTEQAGINPENYFLFSKAGFNNDLEIKASQIVNIHLVDLDEL